MMKYLLLLSAAVLAGPAAASAAAPAPATEAVRYADLDLRSDNGQARLERRIRAAATRLCTEEDRASPTAYVNGKCFRASMKDALAQMKRAVAWANHSTRIASAPPPISIARAR